MITYNALDILNQKQRVISSNGKIVGYINKTYSNILVKLIDIIIQGGFYTSFTIKDHTNKNIVFKSEYLNTIVTKKNIKCCYQNQNIILNYDNMWEETASFNYDNKNFYVKLDSNRYCIIMDNENKPLSIWKNRDEICSLEILDSSFDSLVFLLLGISHAFSNRV